MIVFKDCCFVIPLRIGCFIIGYTHLIYHIVQMIISILILVSGVELSNLDPGFKELADMLIIRSSITLVFLLLFTAFTILMLFGLHKERRQFVKAFLIYASIFIVVYMILFFISLGYGSTGVWNIIFGILEIIVGVYFLLVIRSQYVEMGLEIDGA